MSGFLCAMVGASFTVAAAAEVLRSKKGIIAVGNAQIDTAQSKFGGASALFDGTDDALQITDVSWINWNSDFTVELWIRMSQYGEQVFFDTREGSGGNGTGGYLVRDSSSVLRFYLNGTSIVSKSDPNLTTNTWYHVAITRSGNNFNMWIDGTSVSSATNSSTGTAYKFYIGRNSYSASSGNTVGHIDEFRFSNTARYTSNFTAPTAPFVNDANTLLLLHMNGTDASTFFEDDNGVRASKGISAIGNAQIDTAQSKFGGSSYLGDGTGDYLLSTANSDYNFGTSSFTIEYWIRFNVAPTLYVPIALRPSASIYNGEWWCEITNAEKKMYWGFKNQAGTQFYVNLALAGTAFTTGQWYHIALVNNAGTAQMYVDGVATGTTTALSGSFGNSTSNLWVGAGAGAYSLNGYLDEVRISNTARYTSAFTAPTTPFVNDANTLLLIHADGTDASTYFEDDNGVRNQVGLTGINSAALSTAQSRFGGSSLLGSVTTMQQVQLDNTALTAITGPFTIEFYFRTTNLTMSNKILFFSNRDRSGRRGIHIDNQNLRYSISGTDQFSTTGNLITSGTWHHIALVRNSSNTTNLYIDGTSRGSVANDTLGFSSTGESRIFGLAGFFTPDGNIDEFRISNSARYTTTFTPQTTPFQNDANTLLLLHMDGTDGSTVFFDDNGVTPTHSYT